MFTTKTLQLILNKLPQQAREAHLAPTITNNLVSVSVLCDAGCEVYFHSHGCEVTFNGETIIRGWRDLRSNMWRISLTPDGGNNIIPEDDIENITTNVPMPKFFANSIYECETTGQLITFYHATMGYPVVSTWCKAIDAGYFRGWPGLTSKRVRKFIKVVSETKMGHMDQRRTGIRSTNATTDSDSMEPVLQAPLNDRTHHVYMTITDVEGRLYSDQTGRFPLTSNQGNCYVIIFYAVDGNFIKSYPIKSRHRSQILKAYEDVYAYLRIRGYRPQLHKLDNETSHDVENFITESQAKVQYTPADMHRTNLAERAVRTWKNHFTATRAGTPSTFKMSNWCKMTEQCDITLNMMRPCTTNPLLSAFEAMDGMYSFDATPMAPMGTEILMHLKPVRRHTWDYHAIKAWYFAPALKHYRVIKGVLESGAVRITGTWKFKHHALNIPAVSATDRIVKATRNLATAIQGANNSPPDELDAIEQLRALISNNSTPPPLAEENAVVPPELPGNVPPTVPTQPSTQPSPPPVPTPVTQAVNEPILEQPVQSSPFETESIDQSQHNALIPAFISQDDYDEPEQPRYNLRNRALLVNSQIEASLIPSTNIFKPTQKYTRGFSAANHALQLSQLPTHANFPTENYACAVLDEDTGETLEFRQLIKLDKYRDIWMHSFANELGRLSQGIRDIPGTNTINFIPFSEVPKDATVTYGRIVCTVRPQKEEQNRT